MTQIISPELAEFFYSGLQEIAGDQRLLPKDKIIRLRQLLDKAMKSTTEGEQQHFSDLFSRLTYVIDKHGLAGGLASDLHSFRKFANKVVHEDVDSNETGPMLSGLKALCQVINTLSSIPIPVDLKQIISAIKDQKVQEEIRPLKETYTFISGTILSIGEIVETQPGSMRCTILCETEQLGKVNISLWNEFSRIGRLGWKFARINLFNVQNVPAKPDLLTTNPQSLVVLEPDWLVDATAIAECFQQQGPIPLLHILKKFQRSRMSTSLIVGKIVNSVYDEIIRQSPDSFDKMFAQALKDNIPSLMAIAESDESTIRAIRSEVQAQYNVLKAQGYRPTGRSTIEPTFISPLYGLQGRLDLLDESITDVKRKTIVELKSGKAPNPTWGAWPNHKHQVAAYDLLLDSVFPGRNGDSNILYSKTNEIPLRNIAVPYQLKQTLLNARNTIVALEYRLAFDTASVLAAIEPSRFEGAPSFVTDPVDEFTSVMKGLSDLEKKYIRQFAAFVARENWYSKVGAREFEGDSGFSSLWKDSLADKETNFSILGNLTINPTNSCKNEGIVALDFSGETLRVHNFRVGDMAILYPMEANGTLDPIHHQLFKCCVEAITNDMVKISLRSNQTDWRHLSAHSNWAIEHDYMESNNNGLQQSLYAFAGSTTAKKEILLGTTRPEIEKVEFASHCELDTIQTSIISRALGAKHYFLIQGPPGTGKTKIILKELVQQLCSDKGQRVLLLAFTNRAVDEICESISQIAPKIRFFRLGSTTAPSFERYLLSKNVETASLQESRELVAGAQAIVSTVASFLSQQELLDQKEFDVAIVDEASQLLETHLIGVLPKVSRFILIGDEKQLPAVVLQGEKDAKVDDQDLNSIGIADLRTSLFERLLRNAKKKGWTHCFGMLTRQGRMHVRISEFPSNAFYEGKLETIQEWQQGSESLFGISSQDPIEKLLASSRFIFVATRRELSTKVNTSEARVIKVFAECISDKYSSRLTEETLGIITPFRAQIAEIRKELREELRDKIYIDTIERFQGMQREAILISLAVNHPNQMRAIQALTLDKQVDRKLNVAITRAKRHLVVVGCAEILARRPFYDELIRAAKEKGVFIEARDLQHS